MKRLLLGILLAMPLAHSTLAQDVRPVAKVELDRYVGTWYEIARFPNRFQEQCTGNVTAQYGKRADGEIDVVNRCSTKGGKTDEAAGRARVVDTASNARLKVRFAPDWLGWIPYVWADYWIIELADDYSHAAVGDPSREYLWILSRTPTMSAHEYETVVNRLTEQGFDTAKLVRTPQQDRQ